MVIAFGIVVLGSGKVENFKYDKLDKVVELSFDSWFSSQSVKMKKNQIKKVEILMKGESAGMRNDIRYSIVFQTIGKSRYGIFSTGDRKKIKERYYEVCRVLGLELNFDSLEITKKLKHIKEKEAKKARTKKVYEEDEFLDAEDIPVQTSLKKSSFRSKNL